MIGNNKSEAILRVFAHEERRTPMKDQKGKNSPATAHFPPLDPQPMREVNDPPVPNRAWTEMRLGRDIDDLTEQERRDLYLGRDGLF